MKIFLTLSAVFLVVGPIRAQLPNYQASYRGDFQVFLDEGCTTPSPVLRAACRGSIRVTTIQHASVICGTSMFDRVTGFNYIECTNTCTGTACEGVYLAGSDSNIDFECSGSGLLDVEAFFTFVDSGNGSCIAGTDGDDSRSNVHVTQLGVRCGSSYDFDERYFECNSDSIGLGSVNGALSCFGGDTCGTGPCTVNFDDFTVLGSLPRYLDCVTANNGAQKVLPPSTLSLAVVNAVFEASWARFQEDQTRENCSGDNPTILIQCTNGDVRFIESSPSTVACTGVDMSTMECRNDGSSDGIDGQLSSVEYSCTGLPGNDEYPRTVVTFPPENAFCDGNSVQVAIQHALQLGVECSGRFDYDLTYTECTDRGQRFERYDEFGDVGPRYTCVSQTTFNQNSAASSVREVGEVGIETDLIWGTDAPRNCWNGGVGSGNQLFTLAPSTAPTVGAPASPIAPVAPNSTGGGNSIMPAIIGGVVGVVAVLALAVVLVVCIKERKAGNSNHSPKKATPRSEPSYSGSGGTGFESSYDTPRLAHRGQEVPPNYHPNQRQSNYPPTFGRPGQDHADTGYAGAPPSPRSSDNFTFDHGSRSYDYPGSDSQPSHGSPPQQRSPLYAGPPSTRSSGARELTSKDQCMSVVDVITGVPIQNKEPPLVFAKMVGPAQDDGRTPRTQDPNRTGGRSHGSRDP